jgi:predicted DNA-binding transcriptional regulator AlpA
MTRRKDKLELTSRLTAFVTQKEGAAELRISPSTWDDMMKKGQLPKPYLIGPNRDIKRWRWIEIEQKIIGDKSSEEDEPREPYFRGLARGAA